MNRRRRQIAFASVILVLVAAGVTLRATGWTAPLRAAVFGRKTVADRLAECGETARARWSPHFVRARIAYPPAQITLVGLKAEKRLDVYASAAEGDMRFIRSYPILAASGVAGPKLKRGDRQVPEGVYGIESLNPNSRFHLALRVGYPNGFDRDMAAADGRSDLGSDIMIHGSDVSVGCLAMGDEAAEDLFVLAAETGIERVKVLLAPAAAPSAWPVGGALPPWAPALYAALAAEIDRLPSSTSTR